MESKMPCHISDGPQTPEDVPGHTEIDEDQAYEDDRQREIDEQAYHRQIDRDHASKPAPHLHTKIGKYTGKVQYSYDQAYWWSTAETAKRMYDKLQSIEEGTNHE